jgi:hypothetical protein
MFKRRSLRAPHRVGVHLLRKDERISAVGCVLYALDMTSDTHHATLASRPLPASLEYPELRVHSTAKLFGTDMDDPGLTRVTGTVNIIDIPDDEDQPLAGIEGIGPHRRAAGRHHGDHSPAGCGHRRGPGPDREPG